MSINIGKDYDDRVYAPSDALDNLIRQHIMRPMGFLPDTDFETATYCGYEKDFILNTVLKRGQADFTTTYEHITPDRKVTLYCFFNLRKHLFTQYHIFNLLNKNKVLAGQINKNYYQADGLTFIDIGCGPLTGAWAYNEFIQTAVDNPTTAFHYIGIDIADSMLTKARNFSGVDYFDTACTFEFYQSWTDNELFAKLPANTPSIILNFSYLFANLDNNEAANLANFVNELHRRFPNSNMLLIYQNPPEYDFPEYHQSYRHFKTCLNNQIRQIAHGYNVVNYKGRSFHDGHTTAQVDYQVLANIKQQAETPNVVPSYDNVDDLPF